MILSTKGRYGVRAVYEVALSGNTPVSIKTICENQGLSEMYLEQLFSKLRTAGILKSVRGAAGGYMLGKSPAEITVGDVIRALEGPLAPADCVVNEPNCEHSELCAMKKVWQHIYDGVNDAVDSINFENIIEDYRK